MSTAVLAPPRIPTFRAWPPRPHKFTATEFDRLAGTGVFEGRRPFLLDGVIWEQGPMNPPHAVGGSLAENAIRTLFASGWTVRGQMPLHVDEYNNPFPDFAVVPGGPRDYLGRHPTTAALVVEVADTTLSTDITEKAERYATAGIADYWVLDLEGRRLLVFRDPAPLPAGLGATAYRNQQILGPTDRIAPLAAPNGSILVGEMLP